MKSLSTCKLRQLIDLGMKLAWWLGIGLANCPWHMVPSNVELRTTTSISEPWRRKMYTKISRIRLFFSLVLKRNGKIRHLKTTSIPPCEFCFISCVGAKSSRPPICYSTRRWTPSTSAPLPTTRPQTEATTSCNVARGCGFCTNKHYYCFWHTLLSRKLITELDGINHLHAAPWCLHRKPPQPPFKTMTKRSARSGCIIQKLWSILANKSDIFHVA